METPFTLTEKVEVPEPQDAIPQIPETPKPEQAEKPEGDDEGKQEEQLNSYCAEEVLDTEVLTDCEPDQQHGDCEEASPETDSPKHILDFDQDPKVSSDDLEDDPHNVEPEPPAFPESSNPLLDTSAQRMRAELGKRRSQRTRPPRFMPQSSVPPPCTKNPSPDWRTCDSTDGKVICGKRKGSDSEEEQPRVKEVCSPPSASQRVPMFPGLSPSALMAHLKKRAGGGGEDEGVEKDRPSEETQPSPSQLPRPPRSPALLAGAARVLPPLGGTDGGSASSPSWLKELKSKKRLSQYDTEA
ncbi:uncharacterized protein KIAA1671-like [Lampris incognitus]|uniref:uncharacterized protein KIAA1671-like n=1 Tax=Lampris incognitus TaxID=2546036 RepID=UPI0024B49335|nr:uncharacterized protein KIAA1671-like [Lampris incognitus]